MQVLKKIFFLEENGITEDNFKDALIKSRCLEFIDDLKDGLNTKVGERGTKLSGGQKTENLHSKSDNF